MRLPSSLRDTEPARRSVQRPSPPARSSGGGVSLSRQPVVKWGLGGGKQWIHCTRTRLRQNGWTLRKRPLAKRCASQGCVSGQRIEMRLGVRPPVGGRAQRRRHHGDDAAQRAAVVQSVDQADRTLCRFRLEARNYAIDPDDPFLLSRFETVAKNVNISGGCATLILGVVRADAERRR